MEVAGKCLSSQARDLGGGAAGLAAGAIFAPAAASAALALLLPGCGSFAFSFFGAIDMTVVAQRVSCLKVCMCVCE